MHSSSNQHGCRYTHTVKKPEIVFVQNMIHGRHRVKLLKGLSPKSEMHTTKYLYVHIKIQVHTSIDFVFKSNPMTLAVALIWLLRCFKSMDPDNAILGNHVL